MHQQFQRLYAYRQQEQDIRIVTLRASAVGRLPTSADAIGAGQVKGAQDETPADAVVGPTVISSDYNTVVGW